MQAWFSELNASGGIFGRQIELAVVPLGETADQGVTNFSQAVETGDVFATVGAYTIGLDEALLEIARAEAIPMVGPFTLDPGDAFLDASAFYLYAGFAQQARVLARQAASTIAADDRVVVVAPKDGKADRLVDAVSDELGKAGQPLDAGAERYSPDAFDPTTIAERIGDAPAVIFLGPQSDLRGLLGELVRSSRNPRIYLLSSRLDGPLYNAPATFDRRIHVAYPTLASDVTPSGAAEYRALAAEYSLPREHIQAQFAALAAAKLMTEGLRRAGRELSRERLVTALETLYDFKTGITPPLSYGANRRVGARGAHIMVVDLASRKMSALDDSWHELP
jgi:ABC-type branched-subunit amino acid transport system substrate-binding protein